MSLPNWLRGVQQGCLKVHRSNARRPRLRRRDALSAVAALEARTLLAGDPVAMTLPQVAPDDAEGPIPAAAPPAIEFSVATAPAAAASPPPATIGTVVWQAAGPGVVENGQVEGIAAQNNPVSGAVHVVLAHPTNPDILWVGATNGGLWKTTNATAATPNWTPLIDQQASLSIGALVLDPTDTTHNTLVAGIGRYSSFGRDGGARTGLLRSTDGGTTWTSITGGGTLLGKNISGIAARGSTMVVSVNVADSFTYGNIGIFRSTDGGANFTQISNGNGSTSGLPGGVTYDLATDPSDVNVLYTSVIFADGVGGLNGVYKSVDQGATWSKVSNAAMDALITSTTSNLEIAVGTSNNVYASINNQGQLAGLFRSGNGGSTWTALDTPRTNENGTFVGINPRPKGPGEGSPPGEVAGGQGTIHSSIAADPNNANIVYVGGDRQPSQFNAGGQETGAFPNSLGAQNYSGRLFRVDASLALGSQATSLTHLQGTSTTNNSAPHADSREITFNALGDLIEGDDGGIYRRTNPTGLGDWFGLHGRSLQNTEFHSLAYDSLSNIIFGGTQDVGTPVQSAAGSSVYAEDFQGDGGVVNVDTVTLAASNQSIRYISFQFFQAFAREVRNSAGGLVSRTFPALTVVGSGQTLRQFDSSVQFYQPIVLNSQVPSRGVIGTNDLYESTDQFATLTRIVDANSPILGMAYGGAGNVDAIYYGNNSGQLFLRTTAGGAFNQLTNYAGQAPLDIVLDADDWQTAFVIDSNQVFRTTNAGTNFTEITGNLTSLIGSARIRTVEFFEGIFGVDAVVVGTDIGTFVSASDSFGTWQNFGPNLPNAPVMDVRYDAADDVLTAGTLGRGAWILTNASQTVSGNRAPTDLALAPTSVAENQATNTLVGTFSTSDLDFGDSFTYTLVAGTGDTGNAGFQIVGDQLRTNASFDFESQSSYSIRVRTTDLGTLFTEKSFTISITDANDPPTIAFANTITSIPENANTTPAIAVADIVVNDDSLGSESLSLSGADATFFEIVGSVLQLKAGTVLNRIAKPSYSVTVEVDDATVGATPDASLIFTLTIDVIDNPPTAITLTNVVASLPEDTSTAARVKVADLVVTDDGIGTNALSLSGADAGTFEILGLELFVRAGTPLNFELKSTYDVTVNVDGLLVGATPDASTNFTLNITDVNEPPTGLGFANATTSLPEDTNTATRVKVADLSVTDDALGTNTFSLIGADAASFEVIGSELFLRAGTALDFETKTIYSVTVRVDDTSVGTTPDATANFVLTITDVNEPPSVVLVNTLSSLSEAASTVTRIKVADIVVTDDALGTAILSLSGADASAFEIIGLALFLKGGTVLNFESQPSYSVAVDVDDAAVGVTPDGSASYTLNITDVNELPTLALANTVTSIAENSPTPLKVADVVVQDDALGTETLTLTGFDAAFFEIVGTDLRFKAGTVLNFEGQKSYTVTVNVNDPTLGGNPDASRSLTVNITDVNEAPAVQLTNGSAMLTENISTATPITVAAISIVDDALGTESLSLSGADAAFFEIVNNNLRLKAGTALDFEAKSTYLVTVSVDDAAIGATPDSSANFTLTIGNVNEQPGLTLANTVTSLLETTSTAAAVKVADVVLNDDSIGNNVFSLSGPDSGFFELVGSALRLKAGTVLKFETKSSYTVTVNVNDSAIGTSPDASRTLTVAIINVNEPPTAIALNNRVTTLAENTSLASGLKVADIVITDDGLGTNLLSLAGADAALFEIVGSTLRLKAGVVLDFETNPVLDVTVSLDDPAVGGNPDAQASMSITVTNVNEPPIAFEISPQINEDRTLSGRVWGYDPEGQPLTYQLVSGTASGAIVVNADGTFRYTPRPNFFGNDQFSFRVSDGAQFSNTAVVRITVNSVNDLPVAYDLSPSIPSNVTLNGRVWGWDPEGSPLTYQLVSNVTKGTLTLQANGNFTYRSLATYSGPDQFTFRVTDGQGVSNTATVSITVINQPPVANNLAPTVPANGTLSGRVWGWDPEAAPLTYLLVQTTPNGTLTFNANGNFTYKPRSGFSGTDSFKFQVSDGQLLSNIATVSITVTAVAAPISQAARVASEELPAVSPDSPVTTAAPVVTMAEPDAKRRRDGRRSR